MQPHKRPLLWLTATISRQSSKSLLPAATRSRAFWHMAGIVGADCKSSVACKASLAADAVLAEA